MKFDKGGVRSASKVCSMSHATLHCNQSASFQFQEPDTGASFTPSLVNTALQSYSEKMRRTYFTAQKMSLNTGFGNQLHSMMQW